MDIAIATPLEPELVDRVRAAAPGDRVLFEPTLLPPARYPSDHRGEAGFRRDDAAQRRFQSLLAAAEVHFGVPGETPEALAEVVRSCPQLRWIQGTAAGMGEMVRLAGLCPGELSGVTVTSSAGVHAAQLAEWALLGLLAFTKDLPRLLRDQAERRFEHYPVRELAGQTLLIVGLGQIGQAVARRASALGMTVLGVRRTVRPDARVDGVDELHPTAGLPDLVPRADAVVLALPHTTETAGVFSADLIHRLPAHAIVVNVGRGPTLDEPALIDALRAGRVAGAALEVFATEPLDPASPLWSLPNVLISPHTAALSTRENERIVALFCDNLRRWSAGRPLHNRVDTRHFY